MHVCSIGVDCRGRGYHLSRGFPSVHKKAGARVMRPSGLFSELQHNCILVDPASSHMLVSKIKPCMSKYKQLYGETANGSLNQLWFL